MYLMLFRLSQFSDKRDSDNRDSTVIDFFHFSLAVLEIRLTVSEFLKAMRVTPLKSVYSLFGEKTPLL